jgi:hypothetical protein
LHIWDKAMAPRPHLPCCVRGLRRIALPLKEGRSNGRAVAGMPGGPPIYLVVSALRC